MIFFKDELSRLRIAKVAQVTRSVLFSLKCTRNRLAAGLRPDPLGEPPDPLAVLGGRGPPGRKGKGGEGMEGA